MATQNGVKLAAHIIRNNFGDIVVQVCECLLRKGTLTLPHIIRYTELSREQVTNSLLVLIQHNCVQAFLLEVQGGFRSSSRVTQYMALFDNIIHRMRFPKFVDVVYKELDKQCVTLVEWLLEHGRLTLGQLFDKNDNRKFPSESDLRNTLIQLLNARYVERCPAGEPYISLPTDDEAAAAKKPKRAKTSKLIEDLETTEQRALAAAVPMESLRFSLIANTGIDIGEKSGEDSPDIYAGGKRKHEALEPDKEPEVTQSEKEILWRPNFEEFVRFLRHEACIANVRSRLDNGAVIVLRAILKATKRSELRVKTVNSGAQLRI